MGDKVSEGDLILILENEEVTGEVIEKEFKTQKKELKVEPKKNIFEDKPKKSFIENDNSSNINNDIYYFFNKKNY